MRGRRSVLVCLVSLCALAGGLVFGSGVALAAHIYSLSAELEVPGGFGEFEAGSVAVDDASGDTYVANAHTEVLNVFETASMTQLADITGAGTPAGSLGAKPAVAANNGTGDVYVFDKVHRVVDVFEGTGGFVCQITGSSTPSASECNGAVGSDTPAHGLRGEGGLAIDQATGEVYVLDVDNGVVDVFSAGGAYLRQILLSAVPGGINASFTNGIAVDAATGGVYVADSGHAEVYAFNAVGEYVTTFTGANTPAQSFGNGFISVAVDDGSGEVLVTDSQHQVTDIFSPSGEYLAQIRGSSFRGLGTAVDQANGNVYISDPGAGVVWVWDALLVPDVATGVVSGVRPTSVTLNGTVNPDGVPVTSCVFEYGTSASYGQSAPCAQSPGSGTGPVAVSAEVTGLQEGVTYHYRLVAGNANGTNQSADAQVTTPAPPSIDGATTANLNSSAVELRAAVNPNAVQSTYRFEYGTSTAYGTNVPSSEGVIPAGVGDQTVTQHVTGLAANTTYHWRVVAQNIAGTTVGKDHTFIYSTGGGALPDGRAYELVTPQHKNGALVDQGFTGGLHLQIGEDGSHLVLSTLQCFGDVASCPVDASIAGVAYAFTRTSGGWSASALSPPAPQVGGNGAVLVGGDGSGLFDMPTPPVGEYDLYARGADGSFRDIGPIASPALGGGRGKLGSNNVLAATTDLSHVVYTQSGSSWPFDATIGANSLYEYVGVGNTAPLLVGVSGGPGSTDLISECGTHLGSIFEGEVFGALSADGRTVFFTADACASGSGANIGVAVPKDELFARVDESRTVPVSVRSPLECTAGSGCLGSAPGDAGFVGASVDGSKAFFLDTQQLTDSASEDSQSGDSSETDETCSQAVGANGCNLYEYDLANPAGRNLVTVSAGDTSGGGPRVQGVVAIAPDGSHVYFVAKGVLTGAANDRGETAQDGANNLYVFEHDVSHPAGQVTFIAALPGTDAGVWHGKLSPFSVADVTPDGRFLVFTSHGALTADDSSTTGAVQVFRYDAQTGQLIRISIGEGGFNDNGNAGVGNASIVPPEALDRVGPPLTDPTMSSDGSFVFFESPVALTPGALNDVLLNGSVQAFEPDYVENVYEYHEGHVYLISDGRDVSRSDLVSCNEHESSVCLLGTDATGRNVFFTTADQLVPEDGDTAVDVYDARVCTPSEPCIAPTTLPVPCQGEACHGAPAGTPPLAGVGSAAFSGPGNLAPPTTAVVKARAKKHTKPKKKAKRRTQRAHGRLKRHAGRTSQRHRHASRAGGK